MEWQDLPHRVFVSHAYEDVDQKDLLLELLPQHVSPCIWPRQEPDPKEAVSDGIVEQILGCEGLIYLEGSRSERSLWVNFERDYARRSGRKVFAFDPEVKAISEDDGEPVPLNVRLLISPGQEERAEALLDWMRSERSFVIEGGAMRVRMKEIPTLVADLLASSAVAMWLMDNSLAGVAHLAFEVPMDMLLPEYLRFAGRGNLYCSERDLQNYQRWLAAHSMYVRLNPNWELARDDDPDVQSFIVSEYPIERAFHTGWGVDLVPDSSAGEVDWNRADDLIVRLTLMLQRAVPFLEPEDEDEG